MIVIGGGDCKDKKRNDGTNGATNLSWSMGCLSDAQLWQAGTLLQRLLIIHALIMNL